VFELGNSLREARVRQGLDFPQVELATKIRAKYIRALEDEAFEILPSQTYVKGFLRSYAEYLGLDGQLYVDEYSSRHGAEWYDEAPQRRRPRVHQDRGLERKVVLIALTGIAVLTALVIGAWKFHGDTAPVTLPTVAQKPVKKTPLLVLRGVGNGTYFEVRHMQGGRLVLSGTLGRGDVQQLAGSRFWLFVRHSTGIDVTLGGRSVSLPAQKNLRVLITPTRTARAGG
jgi:helix-turn-helix protein